MRDSMASPATSTSLVRFCSTQARCNVADLSKKLAEWHLEWSTAHHDGVMRLRVLLPGKVDGRLCCRQEFLNCKANQEQQVSSQCMSGMSLLNCTGTENN